MGLFSSIGSIAGGALGSFFGPAGTVVGAGLGDALGGYADSRRASRVTGSRYDQQMALARSSMEFNQAYIRNQLQWRVEDAKKAGLHPMAVLGISSPQYSGPSLPSIPGLSSDSSIDPMEFGQSLNYASTKAKDRKAQQDMVGLQLEGLRLDNALKQAQIDQMQVDTLASSIASNQAVNSPAAPAVNQESPNGLPSGNTFTSGTIPLLGAARLGNTLFLHYNPEIADAVSEDMARSVAATVATHGQLERVMPEIAKKFTPDERAALKRGDAVLEVINPYQVQIQYHPKFKPRRIDNQTYSGKLLPY